MKFLIIFVTKMKHQFDSYDTLIIKNNTPILRVYWPLPPYSKEKGLDSDNNILQKVKLTQLPSGD